MEKQFQSLTLNVMDSATISGTMRFIGINNGHLVQLLLHGGNDDNLIQPRIN